MGFIMERQRTKTTPYVMIDEEQGYIRMEGESYLENIVEFFKEINEWLEKFLESSFKILTFDCAMEYFNSSTTKQIYNMLRLMDKHAGLRLGRKVIVNWIVSDENDEIYIECGEDFKDEMENVEFNIVIGAQ